MHGLALLVVTADPARREQLVSALSARGHHAVAAASGPEAAEALGVPGLDGVVVDLALPGLDMAALGRAMTPVARLAPDSLEAVERRHIAAALAHTRGNKRQAALLLGISRSTLLHKVRRYGLESVAQRGGAPR